MSSVDGWKNRLEPLDRAYASAVDAIIAHIDSLDEAQLRQFKADLKCPTSTNCSWMLWEGKEIALMFVEGTRERRAARERESRTA